MSNNLNDLSEIIKLLENNQTKKKRSLLKRLNNDVNNLISKYEYMYDKYIIRNRSIHLLNQKEKEIAIVQSSIKTFFPYILAYNVALMANTSED